MTGITQPNFRSNSKQLFLKLLDVQRDLRAQNSLILVLLDRLAFRGFFDGMDFDNMADRLERWDSQLANEGSPDAGSDLLAHTIKLLRDPPMKRQAGKWSPSVHEGGKSANEEAIDAPDPTDQ